MLTEKLRRFGQASAFDADEYERRDKVFGEVYQRDFGYSYTTVDGQELDLRPGSPTTMRICENIHICVNSSMIEQCARHQEWDDVTKVLGAFMPTDKYDADVRRKDPRRGVTIVVPMSHQNQEMFQAFNHRKFFMSGIIQRYRSVGSKKAKIAAQLMELVNARQSRFFMEATKLSMMCGQGFAYGRAFCATRWHKETAKKRRRVTPLMAMQLLMRGQNVPIGSMYEDDYTKAEGTRIDNLDHRKVFIDPNVSSNDIKDAQYVGWMYRTSIQDVMRREEDPEERMFNGRAAMAYAGNGASTSSWMPHTRMQYGPQSQIGETIDTQNEVSYPLDILCCCIDIIPRDWKLSERTRPQRWFFAIAADDIVVQAYPLDYDHNEWPIIDCSPNANGLDAWPTGHLALTLEEQRTIDWAMKSRQEAVNTILTGFTVYDQSRFDPKHLKKPGMAKLLPFRNSGFDQRPITEFIHNIQMADPTMNHDAWVAFLMKLSSDGLGTSEVMAGDLSSLPERPGRAGVAAATSGPYSRMALLGSRCEEQALLRLANIKACNTRQYMQEDVYVPIIGARHDILRSEYKVDPSSDLLVTGNESMMGTPGVAGIWDLDFDLECEAISLDSPAFDDLTQMGEVLKTALGIESVGMLIAETLRWDDVFLRYFRKMGFEDINDFRVEAQRQGGQMPQVNMVTMPDDVVMQGMEKGSLQPV